MLRMITTCSVLRISFATCATFLIFAPGIALAQHEVRSPNGWTRVVMSTGDNGRAALNVDHRGMLVASATLGLAFFDAGLLDDDLEIVATRRASRDRAYAIVVGKTSLARDHHEELLVSLRESRPPHRKLDVELRVFDYGVAFRYVIPEQQALADFVITDEHTTMRFPGDPIAHLLPLDSYTTSYEKYYEHRPIAEIGPDRLIGLPLLLQPNAMQNERPWIAVTEANLTDYAGMYLARSGDGQTLVSKLSPLPDRDDGAKVIGKAPFASPWRVLMIADNPGKLIESNIVFHLSDPPAFEDTSWIKPDKTMFPWWNGYVCDDVEFTPGVNTATMKHYIDFCAEQGIAYHSLDGLDIAWYGGPIQPSGPTDVTTAAPSIDMPHLLDYTKAKGVRLRLWMHFKALKPQLDEAFATYEKWGIEGVMIDFMDRDNQQMVRWYHEVAKKAAQHHLTVTWHGAYKPTGMERTWPNVLSFEGVLNQEYNKWSGGESLGTPPRHNLDVAFIRMLAGPLDYHSGGMRNVLPSSYEHRDKAPPVQGTRGHQLAMFVVYQNHLPMLADYPAAYRGQPGFEFLVDVPTNWDETRVLYAEFGKCLVIARRRGNDWYIGGMTADEQRMLKLPMTFVEKQTYTAVLYQDDPPNGSTAIQRSTQVVSNGDLLEVTMPPSGGVVARLTPADPSTSKMQSNTWPRIERYFSPPAEFAGDFGDYRSPLILPDGRRVTTLGEWQSRREELLADWHSMLGPWPPVNEDPSVTTLSEEQHDGFVQRKIRFDLAPNHSTEAYLLVPNGDAKHPAVLVVFYDAETGIGEGKPHRDFALQLVRRGFVTLSVGQQPSLFLPSRDDARLQPLSALAYGAANAYHVLAQQPEVDPARVGIVGHSYGGKWAMFAACLYDKFACAVWSDPGIVFDESRPNVNYWEPWYLGYEPAPNGSTPQDGAQQDGRIRDVVWEAGRRRKNRGIPTPENPVFGLYAKLVADGRDLHELHALMAPRPFLVSGGSEDPPLRWRALNQTVAVNKVLGYENRVAMTNRAEHTPNKQSNEQIALFFEHFLKPAAR